LQSYGRECGAVEGSRLGGECGVALVVGRFAGGAEQRWTNRACCAACRRVVGGKKKKKNRGTNGGHSRHSNI